MAAVANAFQWHQRVHFRVVGGRLAGRDIKGQQGEALDPPFAAITPQRDDIGLVTGVETQAEDVGFIGE
ncbi:hypothetical protein D3C80_2095750 [compost metagenome]